MENADNIKNKQNKGTREALTSLIVPLIKKYNFVTQLTTGFIVQLFKYEHFAKPL